MYCERKSGQFWFTLTLIALWKPVKSLKMVFLNMTGHNALLWGRHKWSVPLKRVIHHRESFLELPSLVETKWCVWIMVWISWLKGVRVCERERGRVREEGWHSGLLLTPHFFLLQRLCEDQKTEREKDDRLTCWFRRKCHHISEHHNTLFRNSAIVQTISSVKACFKKFLAVRLTQQ